MEIGELTAAIRAFNPLDGDRRYLELRDLDWALRNLLSATNEASTNWRRNNVHPVTRWDLEGDARRAVLTATKAGAYECLTCGHPFANDGDFWKHYVVAEIEYPNLGNCWTKAAPEYVGKRPEWTFAALDAAELRKGN